MTSVREFFKKSNVAKKIYKKSIILVESTLSLISPQLNSKYHYKKIFKKELNLKTPSSFNEKLMWLKLFRYNNSPLVKKCSDKYAVRNYVSDCGYKNTLNYIYGVYDHVDAIPWSNLPEKFVLKWNFGCGFNIICNNKLDLDIETTKKQLKKWKKSKNYLRFSEMHYGGIAKKIICERYLDTDQGVLPYDYKIYCFHGTAKAILVVMDRDEEMKAVFMSPTWKFMEVPHKYHQLFELPPRPESLDTMLVAAEHLSRPFPFVRIDFYEYQGTAIFGEMTFTPAACLFTSQTSPEVLPMDRLLTLA